MACTNRPKKVQVLGGISEDPVFLGKFHTIPPHDVAAGCPEHFVQDPKMGWAEGNGLNIS